MEVTFVKEFTDKSLHIRAMSESGDEMASGTFALKEMRFGGKYITALAVCGLETKPQYRRQGLIRRMMNIGETFGREKGAPIAVLHAFSSDFYRRYGYERVSDTVITSFPIETLGFVPFFGGLVPLTKDLVPAFVAYYDRFSEKRNLMFRQYAETVDCAGTYVLVEDGKITGHLKIDNRKHFDGVNRCDPDGLFVKQIGFLSPDALNKLFGFMRMFEGEQKRVVLCDTGPVPEVDSVLKSYMETRYSLRPDIMAKVLDVEKTLALVPYRPGFWTFTIKLKDGEPETDGIYSVSERTQEHSTFVAKLDETRFVAPDITVSPAALSKLVFGFDSYTPETFSYLPGTETGPNAGKALDAFPKQINGWFEHF